MTVLYDHQAFGTQYGGVARYFYDLITALRRHGVDTRLSAPFSNNVYLQESLQFGVHSFPYVFGYMNTSRVVSQVNRLWSSMRLRQQNFDVFHPTFFHPYFLDLIGNKPFVLTYHDAIKDKFGAEFGHLDNSTQTMKQRLFDRAAGVIVPSENTKQDLLALFNVKPEKVTVVHHATHFSSFQLPSGFQVPVPAAYLLYVGTRNDYKNFEPFLQALAPVFHRQPQVQLVCAGGGAFSAEEQGQIENLGLTGRVGQYDIDDNILYYLYQHALAFVYPSRYEGFGIPILEAFAAGCPVVLSDASSFPEVAQDAALYFDPWSADAIGSQIETIIGDEALRQSLRQRGYERQQAFSPEQLAHQTLQVYQRVV